MEREGKTPFGESSSRLAGLGEERALGPVPTANEPLAVKFLPEVRGRRLAQAEQALCRRGGVCLYM